MLINLAFYSFPESGLFIGDMWYPKIQRSDQSTRQALGKIPGNTPWSNIVIPASIQAVKLKLFQNLGVTKRNSRTRSEEKIGHPPKCSYEFPLASLWNNLAIDLWVTLVKPELDPYKMSDIAWKKWALVTGVNTSAILLDFCIYIFSWWTAIFIHDIVSTYL